MRTVIGDCLYILPQSRKPVYSNVKVAFVLPFIATGLREMLHRAISRAISLTAQLLLPENCPKISHKLPRVTNPSGETMRAPDTVLSHDPCKSPRLQYFFRPCASVCGIIRHEWPKSIFLRVLCR